MAALVWQVVASWAPVRSRIVSQPVARRKAATEEEAAARIQEKGKENALASKNFGLEHWIAEICKLLDEQRGMDEV